MPSNRSRAVLSPATIEELQHKYPSYQGHCWRYNCPGDIQIAAAWSVTSPEELPLSVV